MQMIVFITNDLGEVLNKASSFQLDLGKIIVTIGWQILFLIAKKKKSSETIRPHDFQQIIYVKSSAKIFPLILH